MVLIITPVLMGLPFQPVLRVSSFYTTLTGFLVGFWLCRTIHFCKFLFLHYPILANRPADFLSISNHFGSSILILMFCWWCFCKPYQTIHLVFRATLSNLSVRFPLHFGPLRAFHVNFGFVGQIICKLSSFITRFLRTDLLTSSPCKPLQIYHFDSNDLSILLLQAEFIISLS